MMAVSPQFRTSQNQAASVVRPAHWPIVSCDRVRYDHNISRSIACTSHHTTISGGVMYPMYPCKLMYSCTSCLFTPHFDLVYNLEAASEHSCFCTDIYCPSIIYTQYTHNLLTMTSTPMEELNNYNSKWVSFHIRDHLKDGEITVQNTVIEGYRSLPGFIRHHISLY